MPQSPYLPTTQTCPNYCTTSKVRVAGVNLDRVLNDSSLNERRSFIRSFVKEVQVTDNNVMLTYTIPLLPDGIINEELGVPPIVQPGPPKVSIPVRNSSESRPFPRPLVAIKHIPLFLDNRKC